MTSLRITEDDIPSVAGKIAVITGASSGIGRATLEILAAKGATVYALDVNPSDDKLPSNTHYIKTDVGSWESLRSAFNEIGHVDIAVANAAVSETVPFFQDEFDEAGQLKEPDGLLLKVNVHGVLSFVKLALHQMRKQKSAGSIVITASATAYAPEQSLPVYSAGKHALIGLIRALRSTLPREGITINGVAPAATITKLLPQNLATPLMAAGLPVSSAHFVGLAVAYSATAQQERNVEPYGKDEDEGGPGRWNGRVILTLGDSYTEIEESVARLKPQWFGKETTALTRKQQAATDFRGPIDPN